MERRAQASVLALDVGRYQSLTRWNEVMRASYVPFSVLRISLPAL
jgi:hypothetical protein